MPSLGLPGDHDWRLAAADLLAWLPKTPDAARLETLRPLLLPGRTRSLLGGVFAAHDGASLVSCAAHPDASVAPDRAARIDDLRMAFERLDLAQARRGPAPLLVLAGRADGLLPRDVGRRGAPPAAWGPPGAALLVRGRGQGVAETALIWATAGDG